LARTSFSRINSVRFDVVKEIGMRIPLPFTGIVSFA
jgi:hypothetical protein